MVDVGSWLTRCAKASKKFSIQVPPETFGILLKSLVSWVEHQIRGNKLGANIPQLGRFTWVKRGDRQNDQGNPVHYVFIASDQWLQRHKIQSHRHGSQSLAPCTDINYSRLAVESNLSKDLVQAMLEVMMQELGRLVAKGSSVRIPFGTTGFLRAENRKVTFHYKINMERKSKCMGKTWASANLMQTESLENFLDSLQQRAATAPVASFTKSAPVSAHLGKSQSVPHFPPVSPSLGQVGSPSERSLSKKSLKKHKDSSHSKKISDRSSRKSHRRRLPKDEITVLEESMDEMMLHSTMPLTLRQNDLRSSLSNVPMSAGGQLASVPYSSSRMGTSIHQGNRSSRPAQTSRPTNRPKESLGVDGHGGSFQSQKQTTGRTVMSGIKAPRTKVGLLSREALATRQAQDPHLSQPVETPSEQSSIKIPKFMVSQGGYTFNRTVPDHVEKTSELAFLRIQQKMKEAQEEEERLNQSVKQFWKEETDKYVRKKQSMQRRQEDLNEFLAKQVEEADERKKAEDFDYRFIGHSDEKRTYPVQAPWDPDKEEENKRAWKKQIDETVSIGNAIKEKRKRDKIAYEKRLAEAYRTAITQEREEAFARKAADQEALNKAWKRQEMMNGTIGKHDKGSRRVPQAKLLLTKV